MFIIRTSKYILNYQRYIEILWNGKQRTRQLEWEDLNSTIKQYFVRVFFFSLLGSRPFPRAPESPPGELAPPCRGVSWWEPVPASHQCPWTEHSSVLPGPIGSRHVTQAWLIRPPWDLEFGASNIPDLAGKQSVFVHYMRYSLWGFQDAP